MENFSQSAPVNMAPTGIATFAKCPICPDIRQIQADIAVIGAPCDMAIQGRPGARLGPRGIRTQSTRFRFSPQGSYDPERDDYYLSTEKWSVMDCGDIDYVPGDLEQTFGNIEAAVRLLRSRGCLPVVLGGDHSISIPVARGLDQSGPFHVIQLDAHLDWTDQLGGNRLFNGHPMRYMSQLPYVDRMAHLGIHGIGSSKRSDFQDARAYGATILSARQIRAMGAQKVLEQLPQGGRYYVTIDIDAFDYSIAGGTGSPMLGGLLYDEAVDLLEGIARLGEVICVDLVEVSPPYDDAAGTTCYLAARILADFLGFITKERERRGER